MWFGVIIVFGILICIALDYLLLKRAPKKPLSSPVRSATQNQPVEIVQQPISPNLKATLVAQEKPFASCHLWENDGNFEFEIVGESFYQDTLAYLSSMYEKGKPRLFVAAMVLEDNNPHDDKAVAVTIDGRKVGHLSREDARSFRRRLSMQGLKGQTTCCWAAIFGGEAKKDGTFKQLGVWLELKPLRVS